MSLKRTLDQDLKNALLSGDKLKVDTIKLVKSVILNEEIAQGKREQGLDDQSVIACLKKEAKKRSEAAEMYNKAGAKDRAEQEIAEASIISDYLPAAMSEAEIVRLVDEVAKKYDGITQKNMGQVIGEVKSISDGSADGGQIAKIVKERLEKA